MQFHWMLPNPSTALVFASHLLRNPNLKCFLHIFMTNFLDSSFHVELNELFCYMTCFFKEWFRKESYWLTQITSTLFLTAMKTVTSLLTWWRSCLNVNRKSQTTLLTVVEVAAAWLLKVRYWFWTSLDMFENLNNSFSYRHSKDKLSQ